ncbi:putative exporter [Volucribacter psittacicida]|uniref:Putative exporter n=1 Tax=Volucribacter psittacicida TaxID=203482 RepID=A0A4R1G5Q7_9PAST|nr:hypothetical protein [Volucribacter psittacicida]TCK01850.1 putative exporter [Volucribacter psittacicida]
MSKHTALRCLYSIFLLINLGLLALFIFQGNWLQTDLQAVLPQDKTWSRIQQLADKQQEAKLNRQVIALIGGINDEQQVLHLIEQISQQWQQSGLFSQVNGIYQPNIEQLQQQAKELAIATLPVQIRQQLQNDPAQYFNEYAQRLANPFAGYSLLPLSQDWLGFSQFVLQQSQGQSPVQWNPTSGLLYVMQENKLWGLLRAELTNSNSINPPIELLSLLESSEHLAQQQQAQLLATGAMLFSAQAKLQAEQESQWLSLLGISLTLFLLLGVFRHWRVLWLFLPIFAGLLIGTVCTIMLFGQIHLLTLVIGTSLIGLLLDYPVHWLASALGNRHWQAEHTMKNLRFTFMLSLLVTLLGYITLGFTHLPILQQTALFSSVALVIAIFTTLWLLPDHFRHYSAPAQPLLFFPTKQVRWFLSLFFSCRFYPVKILVMLVFIVGGLNQTQWQDNIRQWVNLSPQLLAQAQQIRKLTEINLSQQYLLLIAENDQQLLTKDALLTEQLTQLQQQGKLKHFQSLSQWFISESQQKAVIQQLQQLTPKDYQILSVLNIPLDAISQSIQQLAQQPTISLSSALATNFGQAWQHLYLGEIAPHQVAAIIKIENGQDLAYLANQQDIFWQDKANHISEIFQITRNQAAWLKIISLALASLLLGYLFGIKQTIKMLSVPIFAIIGTLATLGWLHLPVSLFAMFGLLLVSAITLDYTVYLQTAKEPLFNKKIAVTLAATTTFISFALLATSSTPVVASFGLTVSLGIIFGIILTFILWQKK